MHISNPVAANFRGVHFLRTYGRLAPGVTLAQASAEMRLIDQQLATQYPADNKNRSTVLICLAGKNRRRVTPRPADSVCGRQSGSVNRLREFCESAFGASG